MKKVKVICSNAKECKVLDCPCIVKHDPILIDIDDLQCIEKGFCFFANKEVQCLPISKKNAKNKCKDRYVLGQGYVWGYNVKDEFVGSVALRFCTLSTKDVPLKFPRELWSKNAPEYRLVLEKVEAKPREE